MSCVAPCVHISSIPISIYIIYTHSLFVEGLKCILDSLFPCAFWLVMVLICYLYMLWYLSEVTMHFLVARLNEMFGINFYMNYIKSFKYVRSKGILLHVNDNVNTGLQLFEIKLQFLQLSLSSVLFITSGWKEIIKPQHYQFSRAVLALHALCWRWSLTGWCGSASGSAQSDLQTGTLTFDILSYSLGYVSP